MGGTFRNDFTSLSRHQIQKLVDKKRGGQSRHPTPRDRYELPAYWASKLSRVPSKCGHYTVQAFKADSVRAGQQFGIVFYTIVHA